MATACNKNRQFSGRGGFSLIELLTVITIIGILAAILIPSIGLVVDKARKAVATSNLREIAKAYSIYTSSSSRPRTINEANIYDWARVLAEKANFNDPKLYILNDDILVEQEGGELPVTVAYPPESGRGEWTLDSSFNGYPLSFAVVNGLSVRAPTTTTPIAWTRGLTTSGYWNDLTHATRPGVYGAEGGFIVFLDGHVEFFETLDDENGGKLVNYLTKRPTANISEAISPGSKVYDSAGLVFEASR